MFPEGGNAQKILSINRNVGSTIESHKELNFESARNLMVPTGDQRISIRKVDFVMHGGTQRAYYTHFDGEQ